MSEAISWVGIDAGKAVLAMAASRAKGWVEFSIPNDPAAVRRTVKRLQRESGGRVIFCYEAGAVGYVLQRQIQTLGSECVVVAPSLIPVKPGHRIKTDRRDARKLGEMLRAGLLTAVRPPSEAEESARDLVRCRADALEDRARCRHRLVKMLLRRGLVYREGRTWTHMHQRWLRSLRFEHPSDQLILEDYLLAIEQLDHRLAALESEIEQMSRQEPYARWVGVLGCFRGISTITAMTILTELHGLERFLKPRQLMAYLGLVPTEHSSGEKVARGGITKAGNAHVRRVLIEAAHHYRHAARVGPALNQRRKGQPGWAIAIADKAQQRLHLRYRRMVLRKKPYGKVIVAVARELVGFLWAALRQPTPVHFA